MDDYDDYTRQVETAVSIERGAWEAVVADIVKANVERVRELQAQRSSALARVKMLEANVAHLEERCERLNAALKDAKEYDR